MTSGPSDRVLRLARAHRDRVARLDLAVGEAPDGPEPCDDPLELAWAQVIRWDDRRRRVAVERTCLAADRAELAEIATSSTAAGRAGALADALRDLDDDLARLEQILGRLVAAERHALVAQGLDAARAAGHRQTASLVDLASAADGLVQRLRGRRTGRETVDRLHLATEAHGDWRAVDAEIAAALDPVSAWWSGRGGGR